MSADAPNLADASAFLAMFGGRNTFQTFDDTKAKRRNLSAVLHGTLDQHADRLADLNARGAGVFVCVNETDGRGRSAANVKRVRALFVDLDGAPLPPVLAAPLPPHAIVNTSPGKWHCYWLVEGCPLDAFKPAQQALAARFGGDASVCDLPRVMRIPGFLHQKGEPFLSHSISVRTWPARAFADLRAALLEVPACPSPKIRRALPQLIPEGERNATLFDAAHGFVRRGHSREGVNQRLQTINTARCDPPLPVSEVTAIAANASKYPSSGFYIVLHALEDDDAFDSLHPCAQKIVFKALRRFDGANNGAISLAWGDFKGRAGYGGKDTFYKYRAAAVAAGFLVPVEGAKWCNSGRKPDLFAIPEKWLRTSAVPKFKEQRCSLKLGTYTDKQAIAAVDGQGLESADLRGAA